MQTLLYSTGSAAKPIKKTLPESEVRLRTHPPASKSDLARMAKRATDILISSFLMLLLVPTILPILALLIVIESKGSVFFIQERTGTRLKVFQCYKLRTMLTDTTLSNEKRITPLGRFLRRTHLDELPQLWNVLMGDMSLVGPRPHMLSDTERFELMVSNYHLRHVIRPGITGLAQVNGYFGTVEDKKHLQRRVQLDIEYVYTWSPQHDWNILFKTLLMPLKGVS